MVLLVILLFAIADFMIGSFIGPSGDDSIAKGFVGFNGNNSLIAVLSILFFTKFVSYFVYSDIVQTKFLC